MRVPFAVVILALATVAGAPAGVAQASGAASAIDHEIVVRHRTDLSRADRLALRADAGVRFSRTLPLPGVEVVTVDQGRAAALDALRDDPDVLWAQSNHVVTVASNDTYWARQWALRNDGLWSGDVDVDVDADEAWPASQGAGVTVGVADTGVAADQPDLQGQLVDGRNFINDGQVGAADGNGHGTHVAGTIAAAGNNGIGVIGVAPLAKVQAFRFLDSSGSGSSSGSAAALAKAGELGLRIVNGSYGSSSPFYAEQDAIRAYPNTLFVFAAGNDHADVDAVPQYPCAYGEPNVLCVGASDSSDASAWFSNFGATSVDLFAPGTGIWSTLRDGTYGAMSGTSMASPVVAGAAALVVAAHPDWTAVQIKQALLASVDHPSALAGLSVSGGRLNAAQALGMTVDPDGTPPAAPLGLTATSQDAQIAVTWATSPEPDLEGYRVWRAPASGGPWVLQASVGTAVTSLSITDAPPMVMQALRVTAVDASGNESASSSLAYAQALSAPSTVVPPAAIVVPPSDPVPPAAGDNPIVVAPAPAEPITAPSVATRVSSLEVVRRSQRPVGFRLRASAPGRVTVVLTRSRKSVRAFPPRRRVVLSGSHVLTLRRLGWRSLPRGAWRVTVGAPGNRVTTTFRVR